MLPIQDSSFAVNSIYAGMFAEISSLTNTIITNPDLTGLSFARDSLRASLVENSEKYKSISEGIGNAMTLAGLLRALLFQTQQILS